MLSDGSRDTRVDAPSFTAWPQHPFSFRSTATPDQWEKQAERDARETTSAQLFALEQVIPKERSKEVWRCITDFIKADDADFKRGFDAATKTLRYAVGIDIDPDPDLAVATSTAQALVKAGLHATADRATITGSLVNHLFYQVVQQE